MGGASTGRSLEETPTWAVAIVCIVLIAISIVIEKIIHIIEHWIKKKQKPGLYESLEKIKAELMLLGFISLLLTVGTTPITQICISRTAESGWHPCSNKFEQASDGNETQSRRRLLSLSGTGDSHRRILSGGNGNNKCAEKGKVSFMSYDGVHQLHIFIFVLAVSHVFTCILIMTFGRLKMRRWKQWEKETKTVEYRFSHDSKRFRFTRDTSFGRRHVSFWSQSPVLLWIVCFYRQFNRSVAKIDYVTLRHGFIMAHLSPQINSRFDFQKYINRSLEEDFKVVVAISPPIWLSVVAFLLFNTHGWYSYLWLPFAPLIIVLVVGTKLQVIITKMGLKIEERGEVVKGVPVVHPDDGLFWFNRPRLLLHLLNFVLFQNTFQLAFFSWTAYQFGFKSCFHEHMEDIIIRITMGVLIQILCSYVTLPLYALVTQMGSTMKPTIFNDRVANALRKWSHTARKRIKENKKSGHVTPSSGHSLSPIHLLSHYRSNIDNLDQTSLTGLNINNDETYHVNGPSYPAGCPTSGGSTCHHEIELSHMDQSMDQVHEPSLSEVASCSDATIKLEHEVMIE
ncbi:MLO-like protein 12 isoform X2 [Bidens hawaiensis]|uniref:MLO-like protein 12 isoform X2 n=1 Tax=Bidens hawaiensis TaxID=980011 RepID=UPI004048F994